MTTVKRKANSNLLNAYHLLSFDTLDSTNEEAKRLARGGGSHGAVIWAKKQTGGKGRMGREWISTEGNLFVSVLLQPEKTLDSMGQLSFVTAVAVIDALEGLFPGKSKLQCKWPNDVLLANKKLSGILLESFKTEGDKQWVVVGVGINVDSHPPRTEFPATCLMEAGVELVSAKIILSRFIHHFIERYNEWNLKGFSLARRRWLEAAWNLDKKIRVRLPDGSIEGKFEGIDASGNLMLKREDGKKQSIAAGDILPAESVGA